nr:hypothetical protein GCM10020093_069950 [Planobispora longispora]
MRTGPARSARLAELRLQAVERRAQARLSLGLAAEAVPDLDAHVAEHPWREDAWRLLALALYRAGRQGDALAVLRRARALLVGELGVDPGPGLRRLETDILRHAAHLDPTPLRTPSFSIPPPLRTPPVWIPPPLSTPPVWIPPPLSTPPVWIPPPLSTPPVWIPPPGPAGRRSGVGPGDRRLRPQRAVGRPGPAGVGGRPAARSR